MKKIYVAIFWTLLLTFTVSAFAGEDDPARKLVEEYVQKQFAADKDDMLQDEMAKYTKLPPALKEHVVGGVLYDFRSDPFIVVSSYKVQEVKADSKLRRGTARITYKRIARGETYRFKESPHTKLKLVADDTEDVVLNLIRDKGKWLILDPGIPHISCSALKRIYFQYQDEEKEREQRLKLKKTVGGASDRIRSDYQDIYKIKCE